MRLSRAAFFLSFLAGSAEACSLVVPFDEYPGDVSGAAATDARVDGKVAEASVDAAPTCTDVDLQTDPKNCGVCGRACVVASGDAVCTEGRCPLEVVTQESANLRGIAAGEVDVSGRDLTLYYTRIGGLLARLDLDSFVIEAGVPTPPPTGPIARERGTQFLFYSSDAGIVRFDPLSDDVSTLGQTSLIDSVIAMHVKGRFVFWSEGQLVRARHFAPPNESPKFFEAGTKTRAFANDELNVYWATDDGRVISVNAENPVNPTLVVDTSFACRSLSVSGANIAVGHAGAVQFFRRDDLGGATLLRQQDMADPRRITTDGAHFYILNEANPSATGGEILRTDLDGQNRLVIAQGFDVQGGQGVILTAREHVYFGEVGRLSRTTK